MLPDIRDYSQLYRKSRWQVPAAYNIGVDVCARWAAVDARRTAIVHVRPDGTSENISFGSLREISNRLANALSAHGVKHGDRVAILLPQAPEVVASHVAVYKLGAVVLPIAVVVGVDALAYRLQNSGAAALITSAAGAAKIASIRGEAPALKLVLSLDGAADGALGFHETIARAASDFTPEPTSADDPALMIYTSGTTGPPKGALHAHRVLLGHLPGVELPHDFFPQPGDLFWTPADWAWAGGLLDVLLPSLHHGVPVVARRFDKFDPEEAFALMARTGVRNAFIPPTALKMMRPVLAPRERFGLDLRSVASGGEALGEDILAWSKEALGVGVNEFYGQTEANLLAGNCNTLYPVRPGSMGRPIPGHRVAVVSEAGEPLPAGETGIIAVARPDPVMFVGYWNNPDATAAKFAGDWMLTGDVALQDDAGYIWYKGREDDLISSGGYRIGPTDIEDCLMKHEAVLMAAVVGHPDPVRGEVVRAFVVRRPEIAAGPALAEEIRAFVGRRLAWYQ